MGPEAGHPLYRVVEAGHRDGHGVATGCGSGRDGAGDDVVDAGPDTGRPHRDGVADVGNDDQYDAADDRDGDDVADIGPDAADDDGDGDWYDASDDVGDAGGAEFRGVGRDGVDGCAVNDECVGVDEERDGNGYVRRGTRDRRPTEFFGHAVPVDLVVARAGDGRQGEFVRRCGGERRCE